MTRILRALSAVILAFGIAAPASGQAGPDAVVHFGQQQPQPAPGSPASHILDPAEVTINKDGSVLFVMNGGGHRPTIYRVSKDTTRADIEQDLCQGGPTVCNSAATANLRYFITDGKGDLVIDTETNVEQPFLNYQPGLLLLAGGPVVLAGTTATNPAAHRVQYRFVKTGRYLVICGTRGHSLNDYMFGFVNVVGDDDDDE